MLVIRIKYCSKNWLGRLRGWIDLDGPKYNFFNFEVGLRPKLTFYTLCVPLCPNLDATVNSRLSNDWTPISHDGLMEGKKHKKYWIYSYFQKWLCLGEIFYLNDLFNYEKKCIAFSDVSSVHWKIIASGLFSQQIWNMTLIYIVFASFSFKVDLNYWMYPFRHVSEGIKRSYCKNVTLNRRRSRRQGFDDYRIGLKPVDPKKGDYYIIIFSDFSSAIRSAELLYLNKSNINYCQRRPKILFGRSKMQLKQLLKFKALFVLNFSNLEARWRHA